MQNIIIVSLANSLHFRFVPIHFKKNESACNCFGFFLLHIVLLIFLELIIVNLFERINVTVSKC